MINKKSKNIWIITLLCIMMVAVSSGCGSKEQQDDYLIVQNDEEPIAYSLATVVEGDVQKTVRVRCTYLQTKDEEVSFPISGKRVEKVYVKVGDTVEKGQLLAELSGGSVQDDIDRLEYQINRNNILLEQTLSNKQFDIDIRNQAFELWSDKQWRDIESLRKDLEQIEKNYRYTIEDYEDAIALDQKELSRLKADQKNSNLYAGMSGTISSIIDYLEGSTSTKDKTVMKIIDSSECLFSAQDMSYAEYFKDGVGANLNISSGTGVGDYIVYPYQIDKWTDAMFFSLSEDDDQSAIEVGTDGMIRMVLEHKENVLTIPLKAVHRADGNAYVYVQGETGVREVKWITTGIYGDDTVEVIDGLSEGDTVIVK